jgi:hypothetical protein
MKSKLMASIIATGILVTIGISLARTRPSQSQKHDRDSTGTVTGRVINTEGEPVAGAEVYANGANNYFGLRLSYSTNEQGEFSIEGLKPGIYTLAAAKEKDGYPPTDIPFYSTGFELNPQVTVHEQQMTSAVVINIGKKAARMSGRIVDSLTNRSAGNVHLTLRRLDKPEFSYLTGPNLNGKFSILVPAIPFTVEITAVNYERKYIDSILLLPGESKRLNFSLRPIKK